MSNRNLFRLTVAVFYLFIALLMVKICAEKEYHGTISDFVKANPRYDDLLEFGPDTEATWFEKFLSNRIVVEIHTSKDTVARWSQGEEVERKFSKHSYLGLSSRDGQRCMYCPRMTEYGTISVYLFEDNFACITIIWSRERPKVD